MGAYKRGGIWYIDFYLDGRRIRERTKATTRRMAELVLHEQMKRAVNEDLGLKPVKTTNREIIDRYLQHSKSFKAPRSVNRIDLSLRRFFTRNEPLLQARPKEVTAQRIDRYVSARREEGDSVRTINIDLRTLKAMYNKAVEWGLLHENPLRHVKQIPAGDRKPPRYLTKEEIEALLSQAQGVTRSMIYIFLKTGMRLSELMTLEWEDVDFKRRQVTVRSKPKLGYHTKNYKTRHVPIDAKAAEVLRELQESRSREGPYVFRDREGTPLLANPLCAIQIIARKAGVKGVTVHSLRHTYASHLAMAGVPIPTIKELLGHGSITTTMIYAHLGSEHLKEAVGKLEY